MKTLTSNNYTFSKIQEWDHACFYYCEELKMAICETKTDYIQISDFKAIFLSITEHLSKHPISHFLFDKRSLRTFHQPSMEWYFAIWKPEMKTKGLSNHFKILPKLVWFEKAVEAGKHEIFQKYGKDILNGIQITYVESIENAVEIAKQNKNT